MLIVLRFEHERDVHEQKMEGFSVVAPWPLMLDGISCVVAPWPLVFEGLRWDEKSHDGVLFFEFGEKMALAGCWKEKTLDGVLSFEVGEEMVPAACWKEKTLDGLLSFEIGEKFVPAGCWALVSALVLSDGVLAVPSALDGTVHCSRSAAANTVAENHFPAAASPRSKGQASKSPFFPRKRSSFVSS